MKKCVLISLAILTCMACDPIIYAPSSQHVPVLKGKGDMEIEASYADTGFTQGAAVAAAGGVGEQDGIGASLNILRGIENDTEQRSALNFFEAYYIRHGLVGENPKFVWAIAPGIGYAGTRAEDDQLIEFKASFIRPFVQPSIGFASRNFEAILSARLGYVGYLSAKSEPLSQDFMELFKENGNQVIFEPALTLRAGGEFVKVHTQLVLSTFNFDYEDVSQLFFYDNASFSLGLQFYIAKSRE
ncbi:hypothetical protein [Fulvivirga sedimenti]|uniref:Outer membrane protein beta-barrel domain-containing protein n=1 Tax=Fulvivirga sedimenti TaxID=2879465 RepID=A0A9X1L1F1_9BACT|nr:hypothetical protein [Fulvivirga sedimenti]MCA6074631.1 hypothetical protein [Fulvivirga sedimenti]MCA6075808.1 hypothetical protein [Fulvivirga sedimenti]MCA6076936.1 hypothetical protein [Fulvivirga sedimenti]